jgi:CDP-glycerol glycerophosphotransferase
VHQSGVKASVIIPTYNSREPLARALLALRSQTMPADQFEVIVVDDGSTDGTWEELEHLAENWATLKIRRQANSGTPSTGRNVGIRAAHGRFLFFHDADDWMPPDALAGLVETAETQHADVVVGRVCNVGGGRQKSPLKPSADADLLTDGVWLSLSAQKLFRQSLLDRTALTFCEDMVQGEDQVFTATALLAADQICTLTDRDYYVRERQRTDADAPQRLSRLPQTLAAKMLTCTRLTAAIEQGVPWRAQSPYFDRVLLRTLAPALAEPFMRAEPDERTAALTELQATVLPHLSERHLNKATEHRRLRLRIAAVGTADDLVQLNLWIRAGGRLDTDSFDAEGGPALPARLRQVLARPLPRRRLSMRAIRQHRAAQYLLRLRRLLPLSGV